MISAGGVTLRGPDVPNRVAERIKARFVPEQATTCLLGKSSGRTILLQRLVISGNRAGEIRCKHCSHRAKTYALTRSDGSGLRLAPG